MLRDIPLPRLLLYLCVFGLLPLLFSLYTVQSRHSSLSLLKQRLENIEDLALAKQSKQALNRRIRAHYKDADHFYFDQQLESLTFLQPEIEKLEKAVDQQEIGDNEVVQARLDFLTGDQNKLRFTEGAVLSFDGIQETTETLLRPVEVDIDDIEHLLSLIEGVVIGDHQPPENRPLLLILDCKLERKKVVGDHEVLSLYLKLLKREFS